MSTEEYKSKSIYKYRTVLGAHTIRLLKEDPKLENLSDLAAIQYKCIVGTDIYDCVCVLYRPVESLRPHNGTLLHSIRWNIEYRSWKKMESFLHSYKVYLEDDRVKEIEAAERERPLPFIIEPLPELGKNVYTLYSYLSPEHIVEGLAKNLLNPREKEYAVLYGPEIDDPSSFKPLPELALALCSELTPSRQANQVKFLASRLLTLQPGQAAEELIATSRTEVIPYLAEIGEKKENREKARLIIGRAVEMAPSSRTQALCLLGLDPEEAADLLLVGKTWPRTKDVLIDMENEAEHRHKAELIREAMIKRLLTLTRSPTETVEFLHRYNPPIRLKCLNYLGQLKEDTEDSTLKDRVDAIFDALLVKVKDGLKSATPSSAPSTDLVESSSDTTEQKFLSNPPPSPVSPEPLAVQQKLTSDPTEDISPEILPETKSYSAPSPDPEEPSFEWFQKEIFPGNINTHTISHETDSIAGANVSDIDDDIYEPGVKDSEDEDHKKKRRDSKDEGIIIDPPTSTPPPSPVSQESKVVYPTSSPTLFFTQPSQPQPQPLVVQPTHLSLEMKILIGFIGISIMGVAGYGTYKLLERFEKIDATREFFSNNYPNILLGSAAVVAALGLIVYCGNKLHYCWDDRNPAAGVRQANVSNVP